MSTTEQLRLRALRMLNDGRRHAAEALAWACEAAGGLYAERALIESGDLVPFTPREISLGAQPWA